MIRARSNHIIRTLKKVQTVIKSQAFLLPLFVVILAIPLVHGVSSEEKRLVVPVKKEVLGASVTPTKILVSPTVTPTKTVRQVAIQPTKTITPTLIPTITTAVLQTVIYVQSPATNTPTIIPSPTVTVSPTPIVEKVEIKIDYAGQKTADSYTVPVQQNQTAWDALNQAVGSGNIQYTDYGGSLGYFVTGFNGIAAGPNQFYEFRVNGVSSMIGVSFYQCKSGDILEFVLTSF